VVQLHDGAGDVWLEGAVIVGELGEIVLCHSDANMSL
jgi:hypothetical protein